MAYSFTNVAIFGYRQQQVANTFVRQEGQADHLGILFPGVAYTNDMPLLYYTRAVLLALGADVLSVETNYHRRAEFRSSSPAEQGRWLAADAEAACSAGLAQRTYRQITLAGKSLGSLALGHLVATDARLLAARCVWLTPLLGEARLRDQIKQGGQRGLFVAGTADSHYAPGYWAETLGAVQGQSLLIPGADHSLEFPGDVPAGLAALQEFVQDLHSFLQQ